jgi:adenylate cyclase class 2
MPNIEIKARYPDLSKARRIAKGLHALFKARDRQVDTYFRTRMGRLKLRESSRGYAELIPYMRPDQKGPKTCHYTVIPVKEPHKVKALLLSLLGLDVAVEKQRDIFLLGNVRIHLDKVKNLGHFLEFEAVFRKDSAQNRKKEKSKVKNLLRVFKVSPRALLKNSYRELVKKKRNKISGRTG